MGMQGFPAELLSKGLLGQQVNPFRELLQEHFEIDPSALPIVTESFEAYEQPNLHLALNEFIDQPGHSAELHGVSGGADFPMMSLSWLVSPPASSMIAGSVPSKGPVQYVNISLDDRVLACIQSGLYLMRAADERYAVLVQGPSRFGITHKPRLEVAAKTREAAAGLLADLRGKIRAKNVYRGGVLSFERGEYGMEVRIVFRRLPKIERNQIVLPEGLLERIERQTILFSRHSARLRAAGRHLKRGILLYGPPGTGKTLSAMYLVHQMRGRTVFLTAGVDFGWMRQTCDMARALQPSTVILEDVDLVAEDRSRPGCVSPLLYQLLNEIDGLAEDTDVIFLLTTNRAEVLEPALASRPGRIDQAVELPLPDASCRRRLFELYSDGLKLRVGHIDPFVARTEGASAAFIRELLRKAALFAAEEFGDNFAVHDRHLDEALKELLVRGGGLTQSLLGAHIPSSDRAS